MDASSIMLGKYSLPFLLSIVLGFIFKNTNIKDDYKPYIAAVTGIALGICALFYNHPDFGSNFYFPELADYVLAGIINGAAATGIYEMSKDAPGSKRYIAVDEDGRKIKGAQVAKVSMKKVK